MRRLFIALAVITALSSALAACADGEPRAPTVAAPATDVPARPTPEPRVSPSPPVGGTVDPPSFGGTDPASVRANPDPPAGQAILRDVRVGAHPEEGGRDRIVFEFESALPAAEIRYEQAVVQCGSGFPVQLPGNSVLFVRLEPAVAHDEAGRRTVAALEVPGPGNVILQSRQTCDFEGQVHWAVAVRAEQPFRVIGLADPTRLVIDIKH